MKKQQTPLKFIYARSVKELAPYFNNMPTYKEDNTVYFSGFSLMQPYFFSNADSSIETGCQYLVAFNQQNLPIGVLKWKRYSLPDHKYVPEHLANQVDSYLAIRLIDVRADYRQKGVATALVKKFTENIPSNNNIVGGKATALGKQAKIHDLFKKLLYQNYYISEVTLVEEWEEENEGEDWY